MKGLTKAVGMEQAMSTSFHPQTDGQTERMNQTLETYLRIHCSEEGEDWVQLLPTAQMAINSSHNEDVQTTPDELLHGKALRQELVSSTSNPAAQTFVNKMKNNWDKARARIQKAKEKVKERVDKSRRNHDIQKGDKVLLSTKNLTDKKLDRPYVGAFEVQDIKGTTAHLKLPATGIFPKFHVGLLRKAPDGVPLAKDWHYQKKEEYEIEKIIDENKQTDEFLIKWKGFPDEENTWKPKRHLKNAQGSLRKFRKAI